MILTGGTDLHTISPDASRYLQGLGTTWIEILDLDSAALKPAPGPYLASEGKLLDVRRLYDNTQAAFVTRIVPRTDL